MATPKHHAEYLPVFIRTIICSVLTLLLFITSVTIVSAQNSTTDTGSVKKLLTTLDKYTTVYPTEKVYLHFDRPYYAVGDTAWFKAYVLKGNGQAPSTLSAKLYVDIFGKDEVPVQKLVIPVFEGLAQGYIPLNEALIPEGTYTARAYTNWLQNFGDSYFFYKRFNVGKLGGNTWLLAEQHTQTAGADSGQVNMAMRFTTANGRPLVQEKIALKIKQGERTVFRTEIVTGVDGAWERLLNLPKKIDKRDLTIVAEDMADKSRSISFPFYPSGLNTDIDLQFMPEGGSLIAGLYNKVAFKAIGEDGLGKAIKGSIVDSKGQEVATMQTAHLGMGNFMLTPVAGENYTAKLMVAGKLKTYTLPKVKATGLALRVNAVNHANELYVYLSSAAVDNRTYTLLARSRDSVYFGSDFTLNGEGFFNTRIRTNKFPTGIVNLMVLGSDNKPVADRSVFINRTDALDINIVPQVAKHIINDSIPVNLSVSNLDGTPAQGSFSVSVTDNGLIKDSVANDNIQSHILLAADLKGYIENPAWYFTQGDELNKTKALDNLLLTQGWKGFDLEKALKPLSDPLFKPELKISINGKLSNLFGKPATNKKVTLMTSNRGLAVLDTISNAQGRFRFDDLPLSDSATYVIKVHEPNGKSAAVGINVDEFKATQLPLPKLPSFTPWNLNADSTLISYLAKARQREAISTLPITEGTLLKDVTIKEKKVAIAGVDGETFFPDWNIGEKELIKEPRISLLRFLEKNYSLATKNIEGMTWFYVRSARLFNIVIDGTDVWRYMVDMGPESMYKNFRTYLEHYYTTDIKNVYSYHYMVWELKNGALRLEQRSVLVLDTRSGSGPMLKDHYGLYVYRPLPMQLPKQFYSPKYHVKNNQTDLRSTIHWEPNLMTDKDGKASFSFYAAGKPGTYTINIEGTDMQGHFGVSSQKIIITNK